MKIELFKCRLTETSWTKDGPRRAEFILLDTRNPAYWSLEISADAMHVIQQHEAQPIVGRLWLELDNVEDVTKKKRVKNRVTPKSLHKAEAKIAKTIAKHFSTPSGVMKPLSAKKRST